MSGYIPHDDDMRERFILGALRRRDVDKEAADWDAWLASVKAEAWDEGATYVAKQESMLIEPDENPYREEKK